MLEGPNHNDLFPLVTQALPTIVSLLIEDGNIYVKQEASVALEATAEVIPKVYFQEPLFYNLLPNLIKSVEAPPRVSLHISKLWHFIGEEISKSGVGTFM
jgi:Karyopherin (importin) beta